MKIQLGLFIRALLDIPAWSNASPPDSKSGRLGSNPRAGAALSKKPPRGNAG